LQNQELLHLYILEVTHSCPYRQHHVYAMHVEAILKDCNSHWRLVTKNIPTFAHTFKCRDTSTAQTNSTFARC